MKHGSGGGHPHAPKRTRRESEEDRENYPSTGMDHRLVGGTGGGDLRGAVPVANMDGHHVDIKEEWA